MNRAAAEQLEGVPGSTRNDDTSPDDQVGKEDADEPSILSEEGDIPSEYALPRDDDARD